MDDIGVSLDNNKEPSGYMDVIRNMQNRQRGGYNSREPLVSQTGMLIENIIKSFSDDAKYPRRRGNMLCFFYNNSGEPLFALGPGWKRALLLVIIINIGVGIGIDSLDHKSWIYHFLYLGMIAWNIVTVYLILLNPGLAPRDPKIHK